MNDNHMTEACADFLLNLGRWCGLIQGNSPELARLLLNVELGTDPEALKGLAAQGHGEAGRPRLPQGAATNRTTAQEGGRECVAAGCGSSARKSTARCAATP